MNPRRKCRFFTSSLRSYRSWWWDLWSMRAILRLTKGWQCGRRGERSSPSNGVTDRTFTLRRFPLTGQLICDWVVGRNQLHTASFIHRYIMENYRTFENFRFNGKLDLRRLHGHSLNFMRFISSVIDQTDPVLFNTLLSDNHALHTRCNVSCQHMEVGALLVLLGFIHLGFFLYRGSCGP